ncbi:unnamed protein product [Pylaiella littoralis]
MRCLQTEPPLSSLALMVLLFVMSGLSWTGEVRRLLGEQEERGQDRFNQGRARGTRQRPWDASADVEVRARKRRRRRVFEEWLGWKHGGC